LLVIDQPVLKGVLTLVLNHGVFVSRTATNVAEVATIVREWLPNLAIVDMELDDGKLVGALASSTSPTDRIPVIALTRRGDLKTKLDAFEAGADDILTLPFSPEELVARAFVVMQRRYGTGGSVGANVDRERAPDRLTEQEGACRQGGASSDANRAQPPVSACRKLRLAFVAHRDRRHDLGT
jgi:DNA-binding response OmpR family regulator